MQLALEVQGAAAGMLLDLQPELLGLVLSNLENQTHLLLSYVLGRMNSNRPKILHSFIDFAGCHSGTFAHVALPVPTAGGCAYACSPVLTGGREPLLAELQILVSPEEGPPPVRPMVDQAKATPGYDPGHRVEPAGHCSTLTQVAMSQLRTYRCGCTCVYVYLCDKAECCQVHMRNPYEEILDLPGFLPIATASRTRIVRGYRGKDTEVC
eukprot:scaffold94999_cov22-Tisochrysis_lutea.AAC.1